MTRPTKTKLIAAALLVLGLIGLLAWRLAGPALIGVVWHEGRTDHLGELRGAYSVGQAFVCPTDALARIEVRFATYGGWARGPVEFNLVRLDGLEPGAKARFSPGDARLLDLPPGGRIEQTFSPARGGLKGLEVLCSRSASARGRLSLKVAPADRPREAIAELTADLARLPRRGWLWLAGQSEFRPGQRYVLTVSRSAESRGALRLRVFSGPGDFTLDGKKRPRSLLFRPVYPAAVPSEPVAVATRVESLFISDNAYHGFDFEPLADSAGRAFHFNLTAPTASAGNAVTVWADAGAEGPGFLTVNRTPVVGGLAFRAYAAAPRSEVVGRLVSRTAQGGFLGFGGGVGLALALTVQLLLGLGLILVILFGAGRRQSS